MEKALSLVVSLLILIVSIFLFSFLISIVFIVQIFRKVYRNESLEKYFIVCAIGEDQRAGSYLYGTEDYTISGYTYYLATHKNNIYAYYFMKIIDFFAKHIFKEDEHCKKTYEKEYQELHNGGASMNKIKEI